MKNEFQPDELIIRYLSDETNNEEKEVLFSWINASNENKLHFQQLQDAWVLATIREEINKINVDAGWARFKQSTIRVQPEVRLTNEPSFEKVPLAEEAAGRSISIRKFLVATAIAASLIIVFGISDVLLNNGKQPDRNVAQNNDKTISPEPFILRHEKNNSGKAREIILQDGSKVLLFDNSSLEFREPFAGQKRELILIGKAEFKVAKDPEKPFIVYSNDLSTRALGTRFSVSNFSSSKNIVVQLFEGKVVVRSTEEATRKLSHPYYLEPGQQLVYDKATAKASVKSLIVNNLKKPVQKEQDKFSTENPSVPKTDKGSWYMFNNQSLPQVFKRLEDMYGVEIKFSDADVKKLFFIGKFDKSDSLEKILREITEVYNLKVSKENNQFIIRK